MVREHGGAMDADAPPPTTAPAAGRLLVATPALGDPNFARAVVLLLEHGDDGSLGLVLNHPSDLDVADPLPHWSRFTPDPAVVFVGGPVSRTSVIALATTVVGGPSLPRPAFEPLLGTLGVLDLSVDPDLLGGGIDEVRVFAGYAGWGAGQLVGELDHGAWYVVDGEATDAVGASPAALWHRVLARQGGALARVARLPADPSVN